jgi:hypothetical protein
MWQGFYNSKDTRFALSYGFKGELHFCKWWVAAKSKSLKS